MRIEMIGPPTVGKSSLVRELVLHGVGRGFVDKHARPPSHWEPFINRVRDAYKDHPGLKSLPQKHLNAFKAAAYGNNFKGPIVYDELVANCGISLAIRHEPWEWYFEEFPMPSRLIVLTCSEETWIKRNEARGERSRIKKTMRAVNKLEQILPILKKREGNILYFNTDEMTTKQIARRIIKTL